jgi:hypothetical protein
VNRITVTSNDFCSVVSDPPSAAMRLNNHSLENSRRLALAWRSAASVTVCTKYAQAKADAAFHRRSPQEQVRLLGLKPRINGLKVQTSPKVRPQSYRGQSKSSGTASVVRHRILTPRVRC